MGVYIGFELHESVYQALIPVADARGVQVKHLGIEALTAIAKAQGPLPEVFVRPIPTRKKRDVPPGPREPGPGVLAVGPEARRLYVDEHRTIAQTARAVGYSPATVTNLLRWLDVDIRPKGWQPGRSHR